MCDDKVDRAFGCFRRRSWGLALIACLFLSAAITGRARAQAQNAQASTPTVFGVWVDPGGAIQYRAADAQRQLARIRALAGSPRRGGAQEIRFVSLPALFAKLRQAAESGGSVAEETRYLSGLTQVRYVLVDTARNDLLIGGPTEPWDAANPLLPAGKLTGRPVLQLDDVVAALRAVAGRQRGEPFGCSIDPPAHAVDKALAVQREYGSAPRRLFAEKLAAAMGPQQVRFFGVPADTRIALACVAADYQLKRYSLNLDPVPAAGVGHSIDNSRPAGNGFWFEASYEPLLVSEDGNAFELRGPRLMLKAGALPFDERGATETAKEFARRFTEKMPLLCANVPLLGDLANITDLATVAALIRQDRLAERIRWDMSWVLGGSYRLATLPTPRSTNTLVNFAGGSIAAGGVSLSPERFIGQSQREVDRKGQLAEVKKLATPRSPAE